MSTRMSRWMYAATALVAAIGVAHPALARDRAPRSARLPGLLDTGGFYRLEVGGLVGAGTEHVDLGQIGGKDVRISGGGGVGGALSFGLGVSRQWDLDLTAGFQRSTIHPDPAGVDGTFRRNLFLATLKYKIPVSATSQFKFGIGGGLYDAGKLDLDVSDPLVGDPLVVRYREAFGWHATGEVETFLAPTLSLVLGARYYNVEYEARSARSNGAPVSTAVLKDDLRTFNGNGVDVLVGVAAYF